MENKLNNVISRKIHTKLSTLWRNATQAFDLINFLFFIDNQMNSIVLDILPVLRADISYYCANISIPPKAHFPYGRFSVRFPHGPVTALAIISTSNLSSEKMI